MPCITCVLQNGVLSPIVHNANSLLEAVVFEPSNGVYTVANTFQTTQVLKMDAHLDRLEDSARRAGIPFILNREELRGAVRQMILESGYGDVRFRVSVPDDGSYLMLSIEPFKPLSFETKSQGFPFITVPNSARHQAQIKAINWMIQRQTIVESLPQGVGDAILLDEQGFMLETMTANFYAIIDGQLYTASDNILRGISREIVLQVAQDRLSVCEIPPHIHQLSQITEAFFSSSSRGIVPINRIDDHRFNRFSITYDLIQRYDAWVTAHLQEL